MPFLKPYLTLCRVYISLFAACSAATGFFLAPYHRIADVFLPVAGVFLLACGASALNQYQERTIDTKMERTRCRPVPAGLISPMLALTVSLAAMTLGLSVLVLTGSAAAALGLLALLWYNGLYTRLKKITAFAAVPGAAVGMIPPAIGWVSTGGALLDPRLLAICFVFFLWQVPHFWLLLLRHGEEYENAGLPSLVGVMSKSQISRVTYIWIFAAAVAVLMLPLYGAVKSPVLYFALIPPAAWIVWNGRFLASRRPLLSLSSPLFRKINIYLFILMSLLTLGNIFLTMP